MRGFYSVRRHSQHRHRPLPSTTEGASLLSPHAGTLTHMTTCEWPIDTSCLPNPAGENEKLVLAQAVDTAVGVLWAFTGRRFGVCPASVRPCPPHTAGMCHPPRSEYPACDRTGAVLLPGPVRKIDRFVVAGVDVAVDSLVLDGNRVYRANGEAWPDQNLTTPETQPGGWAIHYQRGVEVPAGGAHAAGVLAKEFYAACTGGRCALPRRVQQVQRQGVTVTAVDTADIYATGSTGLTEVDLWISAWNPNRLQEQPEVWSPDVPLW